MVKIEYNDRCIQVPQSWTDVTVDTYTKVRTRNPKTTRDNVDVVALACNVEAIILLEWPAEIFNIIVGHIDFLFKDNPYDPSPSTEINGVMYWVSVENVLSLGEWVDVEGAQIQTPDNVAEVLAIICRPAGESYDYLKTDERAALFGAVTMDKVLPVLAFFLQCKTTLDQNTAAYLKLAEVAALLPRNTEILRIVGAGIIQLRPWRAVYFWIMIKLLRNQLRRYLPKSYTDKIKQLQTKPSGN